MKHKNLTARVLSVLLIMSMMAALCSCGKTTVSESDAQSEASSETNQETTAASTEETTTAAETVPEETQPVSNVRVNGDYVTYPYKTATFLESTPNEYAYGTAIECTAMQGMESTEKYLYVAKQKNNTYANIYQYDPATDTQVLMTYFGSLDATEQATMDCISHVNDMTIYTDSDDLMYMLTAATYHPNSGDYPGPCLTQLQVDEENATLRLAGFFNLTRINAAGESVYVSASSIRMVAQTDEYNYFLIKNANDFYWCKIPAGTMGGTKDAPVEVPCVHLFNIDNRNAVFVNNSGELETMANLESWTNQGFYYSVEEDLLYVQLYNQYNGSTAGNEGVIITFDMEGMLTVDALEAVTENQTLQIYPTNLAFHLLCISQSTYEVESCVFLKNQGDDGDLTLYFNTNGSDVKKYEGIWAYEYTRGSVDAHSIVDENSIVYTVEYNYNVEGVAESDWTQDVINNNYSMLRSTTHIAGITTNLRMNRFTNSGSVFMGWQLYRQSDGTWLYTDGNWYTEAAAPSGMEKQTLKDAEPVDDLTTVNGDVITAYAQWF